MYKSTITPCTHTHTPTHAHAISTYCSKFRCIPSHTHTHPYVCKQNVRQSVCLSVCLTVACQLLTVIFWVAWCYMERAIITIIFGTQSRQSNRFFFSFFYFCIFLFGNRVFPFDLASTARDTQIDGCHPKETVTIKYNNNNTGSGDNNNNNNNYLQQQISKTYVEFGA